MYLLAAGDEDLSQFRRTVLRNVSKGSGKAIVLELSPLLQGKCDASFIMSDRGEKLGYCVVSEKSDSADLSRVLVEIGTRDKNSATMQKLLPNIIRSFKVDSLLVRSDDNELLRTLVHYPLDYYHVFQVYKLIDASQEKVDPEDLKLTQTPNSGLFGLSEESDFDIFQPLIFSKKKIFREYSLFNGRVKIGAAVVTDFGEKDTEKAVFPVIKREFRREGYGSALVAMLARELSDQGMTAYAVVKPEDEIGAHFLSFASAEPAFDLLRGRPKFHERPLPDDYSEE